jgi:hypothetical protein
MKAGSVQRALAIIIALNIANIGYNILFRVLTEHWEWLIDFLARSPQTAAYLASLSSGMASLIYAILVILCVPVFVFKEVF